MAVLTVWTGDGSGTRGLENDIQASHRLDIATMVDLSDEEWTGVSETAVELLVEGTGETKENGKRGLPECAGWKDVGHANLEGIIVKTCHTHSI